MTSSYNPTYLSTVLLLVVLFSTLTEASAECISCAQDECPDLELAGISTSPVGKMGDLDCHGRPRGSAIPSLALQWDCLHAIAMHDDGRCSYFPVHSIIFKHGCSILSLGRYSKVLLVD